MSGDKTHTERLTRPPGIWESIMDLLLGDRRMLDCIQVEVTSRCQGRCIYCPQTIFKDNWVSLDMTMDTFTRLWPLMRRSSRVHLQGWGEPLLNPCFFEMVALARQAGCSVSTTTNGLTMTAELAKRLVDCGLDIIAFSLSGTDAKSNTARQGVDFEKVYNSVNLLQRVRQSRLGVHLEIHFAYLMLASNMEAVRALPDLMRRLGVHASIVSTLDYVCDTGLEQESFGPGNQHKTDKAKAILLETFAKARLMGQEFRFNLPDWSSPGIKCLENIERCLFVSADGGISPCVYANVPTPAADYKRRMFGNANTQDPFHIWQSDGFQSFRSRLASADPDLACRTCPKRFVQRT